MLTLVLPKTMEVGDATIVIIKGEKREVELGYEELLIDGKEKRRIFSVTVDDDNMMLVCE